MRSFLGEGMQEMFPVFCIMHRDEEVDKEAFEREWVKEQEWTDVGKGCDPMQLGVEKIFVIKKEKRQKKKEESKNKKGGNSRKIIFEKHVNQIKKMNNDRDKVEQTILSSAPIMYKELDRKTPIQILRCHKQPYVWKIDPDLAKILQIDKLSIKSLTERFVKYAINNGLIDHRQNYYLIHKDPRLYKVLKKHRIRTEDIQDYLKRYTKPIVSKYASNQKFFGHANDYSKAFKDVCENSAEHAVNENIDRMHLSTDSETDYKFDN
jgi:cytochrome oxidase Cu insertion factor (SCO1/SenC/PrrC family)